MVTTRQTRDWWFEYRCDYGTSTTMFGRSPVYAQNISWIRALEQAHYGAGYQPTADGFIGSKRNCPSGIGGKTCQDDGDDCSLHNYGLAWDIEYQYNRHLKRRIEPTELQALYDAGSTRYSPAIVDVISDVKNTRGDRLFQWLGYRLGDLMHWQIAVPPEHQQVDWVTVPDGDGLPGEGTTNIDVTVEEEYMKLGDRGLNVEKWQSYLNRWFDTYRIAGQHLVTDRVFGPVTERRTADFQRWSNIEESGRVGFFDAATMAIAIEADTN